MKSRITSYNVCYTKLLRVVFAPLYEVLRRRGVRFEFFHRLENVRLSRPSPAPYDGPPHVAALEFDHVITSYSIHYTKLYETSSG